MAIELYNLTSRQRRHPKKRAGRGNASGKGSYSGRGIKGQRARSGGKKGLKKRSYMKQLIKKIPKLGGFRSAKPKAETISLALLEKNYKESETVTLASLKRKKLVARQSKEAKIVATGKLTKKLTIKNIPLTKQAKEKLS